MKEMRLVLLITMLLLMLSGCGMNYPDRGTVASEMTERKPRENTLQEAEVPQEPDMRQTRKEADPEPAENSERNQLTENQCDMENCVHVQWAEDVLTDLSDYERSRLGLDEEPPLIYFSTEGTIEDFKELSLTFELIDDNGNVKFAVEETYYHGTLTPETPLLVRMELMGTIPNNGVSYVDRSGKTRYFAVAVSGYDGSLLLSEFEPQT